MAQPLLEVRGLNVGFDMPRGQIRPVRDVSFSIFPGQTLALVGESGCGKSVTALSILRLIPSPPGNILSGQVLMGGRDLTQLPEKEMRSVRGKDIAMIFQEPMTSLNPVFTIGDQIVEAVLLHQKVTGRQAWEIAQQSLHDVGIADPARRLHEYPHQLSGGMRQRVMIAMALSCQPKLLIADEPTTALDVTIQAQILELLRRLQRERHMAILLITHDLGVVAENADVVAVMYASRVVEMAPVEELYDHPLHPYTVGLLHSVPKLGAHSRRLATIPGMVPNPARFPAGCKFHPRCEHTRKLATTADPAQTVLVDASGEKRSVMARCTDRPLQPSSVPPRPGTTSGEPDLREVRPNHWASCHFVEGYEQATPTVPRLDHRRQVVAAAVEEPSLLSTSTEVAR